MSLQKIEIEVEIPEEYKYSYFGTPSYGEIFIFDDGEPRRFSAFYERIVFSKRVIIVAKKQTWRTYTLQVNNGTEEQDNQIEAELSSLISGLQGQGFDILADTVTDTGETSW